MSGHADCRTVGDLGRSLDRSAVSTNANSSLVNIRVGDTAVPLKSVPQCRVCGSSRRFSVEKGLAEGRTYRAIVRSLPDDAGLSEDNVRSHYSAGHMPIQHAAVQEVAARQGEELGSAFEPAVSALADHLTLATQVVARVRERLTSGEEQPTVRDGLAAIRLLAETEGIAAQQRGVGDYETAMITLVEVVRESVSPETYAEIGERLSQDPVIRSLGQHAL